MPEINRPALQGAVHILTVHFNTPELTSRLVRHLPLRTPQGRPIFVRVLDNASTLQNLSELCTNIEGLPGVTLDVNERNAGFGSGVNQLAAHADISASDILWVLNSDTRLRDGCLGLLEAEIDRGDFEIVSPLIYSGDEKEPRIWYCGGSVDVRQMRARHDYLGDPLDDAPRRPFETEFITGAAPMMLASTFRAVGGFSEDYFMYWEDALFCRKARRLGFSLGVVPLAHLWHAVGASSGHGLSRTYYFLGARNRFTLAADLGVPRRRLILGSGGLQTLRHIAHALREREGRLPKLGGAIRGTLAGFRGDRGQ